MEILPGVESSDPIPVDSSTATTDPPPRLDDSQAIKESESNDASSNSLGSRRRGFLRRGSRTSTSARSSAELRWGGGGSEDETEGGRGLSVHHDREENWGVGDELKMGLG